MASNVSSGTVMETFMRGAAEWMANSSTSQEWDKIVGDTVLTVLSQLDKEMDEILKAGEGEDDIPKA